MFSPGNWFRKWPHKERPVWESWAKVHTRFGIAAQGATEIESALIMLVAQMEQAMKRTPHFQDLLIALEKNGEIPMGPLITSFSRLYPVTDDLQEELKKAHEARNYLIHHFYRDRADLFTTPEGCDQLIKILVDISDQMNVTLQYLEDWRDRTFGYEPPENVWDRINEDFSRWQDEQQKMLNAILGRKKRLE